VAAVDRGRDFGADDEPTVTAVDIMEETKNEAANRPGRK
jgi:hypothetical protein